MSPSEVQSLIEAGLADSQAWVGGDDGRHFEAVVVCPAFASQPMIKQHRMVFATLGDNMRDDTIHALSLKTFTPEEWDAAGQPKPT